MKKYKSLAEVVEAVKAGEWPKDVSLTIDNDSVHAYAPVEGGEEDDYELITTWGRKGPYALLDEALDLLGVPHMSA